MVEIPRNPQKFIREGLKYASIKPKIALAKLFQTTNDPVFATLIITRKCNLKCKFCFINHSTHHPIENDLILFKKTIDQLVSMNVMNLTLTGGEPMLHPGIFEVVSYAKNIDMTVGFTTNGTLLTEENIMILMDNNVDRVSVSIDGPEKIHDHYRGQGSYKKSVEGLKRLIHLNMKRGKKVEIRINTLILPGNLETLTEMFKFCLRLDIQYVLLPFTRNALDYTKPQFNQPELQVFSPNQINMLAKEILRLKHLKNKYGILLNPDKHLNFLIQYHRNPHNVKKKCYAGNFQLTIFDDFEVNLCPLFENIGNIKKNSLVQIWRSSRASKVRHAMEKCNICVQNCMYLPDFDDAAKDFILRPILRKLMTLIK